MIAALIREAADWCRGRNWLVRAPLLAYFAYAFMRHLHDPLYTSVIGALNLGIHELGHLVFGFMGEAMMIAGGTIAQLSVPVFAVFNFYRQRDFFAIALSFGWLSTNFFNVAAYAADARRQALPLVGIGDSAYHDWEYMLGKTGLLECDAVIAGIIRLFGLISMIICLAAGSWLLWQMSNAPRKRNNDLSESL
ncbi:MAG TPA: hypothetical protein PLP56_00765 [Candidatus Omnitrophota bacterium]|nr:hypothetical protein [Candidatus Omnitrophota bacterium]HQO37576.1 hypothetical protein [Candidatus Omnitrophota bacterium]HQQ05496.1 hypothetical protein [Candidatus Omnitrophota bacterium]